MATQHQRRRDTISNLSHLVARACRSGSLVSMRTLAGLASCLQSRITMLRRIHSIDVVALHLNLIPSPCDKTNRVQSINPPISCTQYPVPHITVLVLREVEVSTQVSHVQPSENVFLCILLLTAVDHCALATLLVCLAEVDVDVAEDVVGIIQLHDVV